MAGIWQSSEGIQGALYINGKWSAYQTLATGGQDPALAFHPSDATVYAVWRTSQAIQTVSFNAASHSTVAPLSSSGSSLSPPNIYIDANGNALAIWSILLGETTVVQIARGS